jgi:hypothetical protein
MPPHRVEVKLHQEAVAYHLHRMPPHRVEVKPHQEAVAYHLERRVHNASRATPVIHSQGDG